MKFKAHDYLLMLLLIIGLFDLTDLGSVIGYENYRLYLRVGSYMVAMVVLWQLPRKRISVKLKHRSDFYLWAIIMGFLYLMSTFFGGILNGFGESPYTLTPKGITLNLLMEVFPVVATIWIRFYVIQNTRKKAKVLVAIGVTILIALSQFSMAQLTGGETLKEIVSFYAAYVIPELAVQSVVTYFTIMAGAGVGVLYYIIITVPFYVLNVIPDLEWLTALFIKTVLPLFGLMVLHEFYTSKTKLVKLRNQSSDSALSMMVISIVSVMLVWFAVGVFPIFPNVVLTGSMIPEIMPGDIVLIEKASYDEVNIGDVLYFQKESIHIVHRVIEIDDQKWTFQTKGDNNTSADSDRVESGQVRGVVRGKVPYIGKIILWFRGV